MTTIRFIDGKPILRDGKVSTNDECCVCPACCQHLCNKMCCNQIKWVVPESEDSFTTVDTNCRATLELPDSVRIRVRVRCSGYVYGTYGETPDDCDTDCEIVEVEYSEDGGTTWTTTPPSAVEGITWSIYCDGDAEQPTADASAQRCAILTATNQETCENVLDGEFSNLFDPAQQPWADCGLTCGPQPTEWRVVDHTGRVWFAGDIIENPAFEGEVLCTDSCAGGLNFQHPRLLLQHFPWSVTTGRALCNRGPSGWPVSGLSGQILEVLGCDGTNWSRIQRDWCGCYVTPEMLPFSWLDGSFPDTTDPCNPLLEQFTSIPPFYIGAAASVFYTTMYQSPAGCACLRDSGGDYVTWGNSAQLCCRHCNRYFGVGDCGSGLEYLGHTQGVRFTGAVDQEGSNLWNWQDANGDSPACWLPTENGYGGPFVGDRSIVIAGALRSWRSGYGRDHPGPVVFSSVSMEPGAVLALSLTAGTLTVDAATIEAIPFGGQLTGYPAGCANAGDPNVKITVTGTATFINGGENLATGDDGYAYPWDTAGVTGTCVFETGSKNVGTIGGTCTFSDDASNDGKIAGDCTFADTAANNGSIWGNCTFSGDATNEGAITGDCTFTETAANNGTITGDATFSGNAVNAGTVTGNATFIGNATNTGTVNGNATFANSSYTIDPTAGGVITGTVTFSSETPVSFVLSGSSVWSADASAWVFTTSGQNWTFNGSSSNTGTVDGDATFNGSSSNSGNVTGDATFNDTSNMAGNVTGTATFNDDACYANGTAGTFDPDPPPAC